MTTQTDIVNRALQIIGARSTVTATELTNNSSNEAIQANLIFTKIRDDLLRMAPWNCALNTALLNYMTSSPGTAENSSPATANWQRGQPIPPWAYEYQYPVDCIRACRIVPSNSTGFAGVPIFPTTSGNNVASGWLGPPAKFSVEIDQVYAVTLATVAAGGVGHAVGDVITLGTDIAGNPPVGAPAQLTVLTLAVSAIATVSVLNHVAGSSAPLGGSYFVKKTNPIAQGSTTGSGTGATFNLNYSVLSSQRVILTNQQNAILAYVKQVTDPNVMDSLFQEAWAHILGAKLAIALTGDKAAAKMAIEIANDKIVEARAVDGNEGLTVNDLTPDWLRVRGINFADGYAGGGFNWGGLWPVSS